MTAQTHETGRAAIPVTTSVPVPDVRDASSATSPATVPALRRWLLTGVGYMIPFVVTGGVLIAAGYLFGGTDVPAAVSGAAGTSGSAGAGESAGAGGFGASLAALADPTAVLDRVGYAGLLFLVGTAAMSLMVPVLASAIAYAMAGPLALVAGAVGGLLATATGAGYLGGLLAGLLAGGVLLVLRRLPVPATFTGLFAVVLAPMLSTLVVGLAIVALIGPQAAAVQQAMTDALSGLAGTHAGLLGLVLGLMVAVDIGGPINKTAYAFALSTLAGGDGRVMAAVMAAGVTPPLAMALASAVRPRLFPEPLRTAGRAGWLLGASFVTEGAIPFAAADPLRVIPALMAGSAVAGGVSMSLGAGTPAPHGGIWVLGLIDRPLSYLVAVALGVLVSAGCVLAARTRRRRAAGT